jgi:hypothetical protein
MEIHALRFRKVDLAFFSKVIMIYLTLILPTMNSFNLFIRESAILHVLLLELSPNNRFGLNANIAISIFLFGVSATIFVVWVY